MFLHLLHRDVLLGCLISFILLTPYIAAADQLALDTPTPGTLAPSATAEYTLELPTPGQLAIVLDSWLSTDNLGEDFDRLYLYNAAGLSLIHI